MQRPLAAFQVALRVGGPSSIRRALQVGVWLSLVEHRVRDAGVAGSNPATPTIYFPANAG